MRILTVYSTTNQEKQDVSFSGTTFGDLKVAMGITSNNLVARGRETKTKYELNDSILNPQDSFIFISTKKQENGGMNQAFLNELRDEMIEKVNDIFDEMIDELPIKSQTGCDTPDCLEDELREIEERERRGY